MLAIALIGSIICTSFLILNYYKIRSARNRFALDQSALGLK